MAKNTIKLKDYLKIVEEYPAASAITPGMLVEITSAEKVEPHGTEDGKVAPVMFATEDEFQGKTISDEYDADEPVQCWIPQRGDVAYALLSGGEDASIGDFLVSNGDGTLAVQDSAGQEEVVAVALEDVDNSDSAGMPDARIIVRIV